MLQLVLLFISCECMKRRQSQFCVCICLCMCRCAHVEARGQSPVLFQRSHPPCFQRCSLTDLEFAKWASLQAPGIRLQFWEQVHSTDMGSNSGPHVCKTSILPTEPLKGEIMETKTNHERDWEASNTPGILRNLKMNRKSLISEQEEKKQVVIKERR